MSKQDVEKIWKPQDDMLLVNQLKLRGLAFVPEEDWVMNQLPKDTGVPLSALPDAAAALKLLIEPAPQLELVTSEAPDLLNRIKAAAQQRDTKQLDELLHPELADDKAKVYDLFDVSNYKAHTLGTFAREQNREVSVQFFQLTASGVEKVHYVYFSNLHGHIVMRDVKSGPQEAERFMRDEEELARNKLQLMFRALNDGDDAGVKLLCTEGLYNNIKEWGGDQHPGDRLTRGRRLDQVTVTTSVPLDQKSVRVVARISYPLTPAKKVEFDADFERVGNDLKIVRVRDVDNKYIVFDPNSENYLNRRYGLPDGPVITKENVPMTEQDVFISIEDLKGRIPRVLADHNSQKIKDLAQTFIDSNPTGGVGYGLRVAADQLLGKYDDEEKDATRALELNGTVYMAVERHAAWANETFTPVVLGISKSKIDYTPAPGRGMPEVIDIRTVKVKFDTGSKFKILSSSRPFMSLEFRGVDGKRKTYNLAAFGTSCTGDKKLVPVAGGSICGATSGPSGGTSIPIFDPNTKSLPVYVPEAWQQDLTAVLRTIQEAAQSERGSR
ncbi:MAG TPA: hypothetical protein VHZ07_12560 [Bryobacteraceae bacterium]|nr:hypothetical protein [Bryobacteraceae bacterium]